MANVTPAKVFEVATGFMAAKHLFVANEVGLFEKLAEGAVTLNELTRRIDISAPNHTHCSRRDGRPGVRGTSGRPLSD